MTGDQAAEGSVLVPWRPVRRTAPGEQAHPFEVLYQSRRLAMVQLAAFLVDDVHLAEDIVQDAFAGMHAHWRRLRDEGSAEGYLRRAVVNRSRSQLRRRRTARSYEWPAAGEEPGANAGYLAADEHNRLRHAVSQLPRRQREVLVLRYWADLSEAEIADAMGISAGTVKSTASRAVRALESVLARS
jgi:RNA polymerase sigma-70 factor (sigma-E family)